MRPTLTLLTQPAYSTQARYPQPHPHNTVVFMASGKHRLCPFTGQDSRSRLPAGTCAGYFLAKYRSRRWTETRPALTRKTQELVNPDVQES